MYGFTPPGTLFLSAKGRAVAYVPRPGTQFGTVLLRGDDGAFNELLVEAAVGVPRMHNMRYSDPHRGFSGGFLHRHRDSVVIDGERFVLADQGFDPDSVTVVPLAA